MGRARHAGPHIRPKTKKAGLVHVWATHTGPRAQLNRRPLKAVYLHSALNQHRQMTVILTLSLSVITYHNQQNTDTHTIKKQNEIETVNSWVWHKPTNSQGMVSTKHTTACKLLPIHENDLTLAYFAT